MELLKSTGLFLAGVLKRVYWYLPPLILDPFDLAGRLLKVNYQTPQWLAWSLFGFGWFMAIILTYHELRQKKVKVDKQIAIANDTLPNVEYKAVASVSFQGAYYVRLLFRNTVVSPLGDISTAQDTKAIIEVYTTKGGLVDFWNGRWAENRWPISYEDIPTQNKRNITANDTAILDIGARIEGQVQFKGHFNWLPDSPEPFRKLLNPDTYYVKVEIWAANMKAREPSWFILQVLDIPQTNDTEQVKIAPTKKPSFDKAGSQP